jgi:cytochrome c biogenesis protein
MKSGDKNERDPGGVPGAARWLWRLLSSVKFAIILILFITGLSLIGAFTPSIDIFHSWLFISLGALLMLNILVCSLNRWNNIKLAICGGAIKQKESFYESESSHTWVTVPLSPETSSEIPHKVLRKLGYRVRREKTGDRTYLAADKNRYFRLGTLVSHISLILFILAGIIGGSLGFRDIDFMVAEGETKEVGHNTHLSLNLTSFEDEYYPDNTPKDYRSQVVIYEKDKEVSRATVRVNHPLEYKGIRFYQSFFGQAVGIRIQQDGKVIYEGNVTLDGVSENQGYLRNIGFLDLAEHELTIGFLSQATNMPDPLIPTGQLAVDVRKNGKQAGLTLLAKGSPLEIAGMEIFYQNDAKYSGFQVSRDPGNTLIWVASSLFFLGMIMVLYFPYRQVWALIQPSEKGGSRVLMRLMAQRGSSIKEELKTLRSHIEKELPK